MGDVFSVMASEPTTSLCSNDLAAVASDQLVLFSPSPSSSKPSSSKSRRSKRDKRPIECTDTSDDGANGNGERDSKKRRRKPPPPQSASSITRQEKSGYSSSEETSSSDFHRHQDNADHLLHKEQAKDDASDNTALRRRKPAQSHRTNVSQSDNVGESADAAPTSSTARFDENSHSTIHRNDIVALSSDRYNAPTDDAGWELVDKYPKESDISLTETCQEESSDDDFWKSDSQRKPLVDKVKEKSSKKRKSGSAKDKPPGFIRRFFGEWRNFKRDNREAVYQLKVCRNNCLISFLLVFIYCGLGGIIFHTTEGAFEMFYKCGVKRVKRDFLDTLWSKSNYMREEEWKSTARNKLMEFENQLYDAYEAGMNSYSGQRGWSFINSLVYCVTLVTTIGEYKKY